MPGSVSPESSVKAFRCPWHQHSVHITAVQRALPQWHSDVLYSFSANRVSKSQKMAQSSQFWWPSPPVYPLHAICLWAFRPCDCHVSCWSVVLTLWMCSALFMLRDSSFIDDVPEEHRKDFVDSNKLAPYKLKILKKMILDRFPVRTLHRSLFCFGSRNSFLWNFATVFS